MYANGHLNLDLLQILGINVRLTVVLMLPFMVVLIEVVGLMVGAMENVGMFLVN